MMAGPTAETEKSREHNDPDVSCGARKKTGPGAYQRDTWITPEVLHYGQS